ncbi:MAG: hypothetical protein RSD28_03990 [Lachnospiraceae bacterium]
MQQVFQQLGAGIIAVLVALVILTWFVGNCGLTKIGIRLGESSAQEYSYIEQKVLMELCKRVAPKIEYQCEKCFYSNSKIQIQEAFQAMDAEGAILEIGVKEITDIQGNSKMECYQKEKHWVEFQESGRYVFTLQAKDKRGKSTTEKITLTVDKG